MGAAFTPARVVINKPVPGPKGADGDSGGSHSHPEYAIIAHSHPEYADALHTHSGYALDTHNHNGVYAPVHAHPYASDTHNHDATYALIHAHPYASDTHNHTGVYAPVHSHPYASDTHNHDSVYALIHSHPYDDAGAAAAAVTTHVGLADPHTQYLKESDASWVDLTDGGATTLHSHSGGGAHPDLATHDALGLATDSEVTSAIATHAGLADPHTGYQKESEKGVASGYASLDSGILVPIAQLPVGTGAAQVAAGNHGHTDASVNFSTASQAITANTVTYITGSGILIPSAGIVAGQMFRWYIGVTKTAAGTATPIWTPRIGANQTTADGTVLTITGTAQVATASGTLIIVTCHVRVASATGTIVGSINTGAASFGIGGNVASGSYDTTGKAGQRFGLCVNTGASAAWTVQAVRGELVG